MKEEKRTMAAYMDMPTAKAVLINALPAMAALCMAMIYSLADMFFIGKTNDPYQVAAIALASPVFMICVSFGTIFAFNHAPSAPSPGRLE